MGTFIERLCCASTHDGQNIEYNNDNNGILTQNIQYNNDNNGILTHFTAYKTDDMSVYGLYSVLIDFFNLSEISGKIINSQGQEDDNRTPAKVNLVSNVDNISKTRATLLQGRPCDAASCTFQYVSNFTTVSRGFSATARLSCIVLHHRPFKC